MDEDDNTWVCPVCGGKLEYFVEFSNTLCIDCDYQTPFELFDLDDDD